MLSIEIMSSHNMNNPVFQSYPTAIQMQNQQNKHLPSNHIGPQRRCSLKCLHKLTKPSTLLNHHKWDTQQEPHNTSNTELIAHTTQSILKTLRLHDFLILIPAHGREHVCQAGTNKCTPRKVQFIYTCQDDTSDDNG